MRAWGSAGRQLRRGLFGSRTREIDLDASAVLFADKQPVDVVFFRHLVSDGSVRHTGDNLVGGVGQGGDDEANLVDLQRVRSTSTRSSSPSTPSRARRSRKCRTRSAVWWTTNGQELARYTLAGSRPVHGADHGEGARGPGWQMTALGTPANGRTFQDLMPAILPHL